MGMQIWVTEGARRWVWSDGCDRLAWRERMEKEGKLQKRMGWRTGKTRRG